MPGFEAVDDDEMAGLLAGASRSAPVPPAPIGRLLGAADPAVPRSAAILDNVAARLAGEGESDPPGATAHDRVRAELARGRRIDWDELSRGST